MMMMMTVIKVMVTVTTLIVMIPLLLRIIKTNSMAYSSNSIFHVLIIFTFTYSPTQDYLWLWTLSPVITHLLCCKSCLQSRWWFHRDPTQAGRGCLHCNFHPWRNKKSCTSEDSPRHCLASSSGQLTPRWLWLASWWWVVLAVLQWWIWLVESNVLK